MLIFLPNPSHSFPFRLLMQDHAKCSSSSLAGSPNLLQQVLHLKWLSNNVVHSSISHGRLLLFPDIRRNTNDIDVWQVVVPLELSDFSGRSLAIHDWHLLIHEYTVERRLLCRRTCCDYIKRLFSVFCGSNLIAFGLNLLLQQFLVDQVVL